MDPTAGAPRTPKNTPTCRCAAAAALLAALCGLATAAHAANAPDYRIGPAPAWVQPVVDPLPAPAAIGTTPGGERWWLVDRQTRVAGNQRSAYVHTIVEAVTEAGVAEAAKIEVAFDPSYATLTLHDVRIWRRGQPVSRLADAQVRVLQREPDLESRIYDGRRTASLVLPDVRPGDAVEVAYTVDGRNPVFGRHEFGTEETQWEIAVTHVRYRLLVDAAAAIETNGLNGAPVVRREDRAGSREFVWEARDVPALRLPADTPTTYDPYARVGWTDFADWGEVARWAEPLYQPPARLGAALQAERDRIAAAFETPQARTSAVLRLVQEQVRYLGVEMGANSHAPSAPDLVFKRRYGDCKEKALLVVTLLRALGIDASPALVDTVRRGAIAADLPSPESFDHVIARVRIAGVDYWLDATRAPQLGDLRSVEQSDFGLALVLDGRSTALTPMPPATPDSDARDEHVEIDLSHGSHAAAAMQVTTVFRRGAAERMRAALEDDGLDAAQDRALDFYEDSYPGVRSTAPMEVRDDAQADTLTIVEHYAVPDLWRGDVASAKHLAEFELPDLHAALASPADRVRRAPLDLGPPERLDGDVVVKLPRSFPRSQTHDRVDDPVFQLERTTTVDGDRLTLAWHFRRDATSVEPAGMRRFEDALAQAGRLVAFSLREPQREPIGPGDFALVFGPALVVIVVLLTVAARIARRGRDVPAGSAKAVVAGAGAGGTAPGTPLPAFELPAPE